MATLYELNSDWMKIMDMIEDDDIDQDMLLDAWIDIDMMLEEKADAYTIVMKQAEAQAAMLKAEEDRLSKRRKSIDNKVSRLGEALQQMMVLTGKTKFKTDRFSYGIQKNPPKVVIDKEDEIPIDYMIPQPMKVDTAAIKKMLKDTEVEWAHLEQGESLRIR